MEKKYSQPYLIGLTAAETEFYVQNVWMNGARVFLREPAAFNWAPLTQENHSQIACSFGWIYT